MATAIVAPLAGAWIEIKGKKFYTKAEWQSLPSRERGLKLPLEKSLMNAPIVAPLAGAWIEIVVCQAWQIFYRSLPSRERGLK